jgi:hypothetical protein
MEPFLRRYYTLVDRRLADPHDSKRYPNSAKYEDLIDIEEALFNELLKMAGQESLFGYAEATITLNSTDIFYRFPEGYRQFLVLERRDSSDRKRILDVIKTKPLYGTTYGIEILTATRGFKLDPPLNVTEPQDWVLKFLRSPGELHFAFVEDKDIKPKSVQMGTPPSDGGNAYPDVDDYYAGVELRIFQADVGVGQVRDVTDFKNGTFILRHEFSPLPQGNVGYEIAPSVPRRYDSIYALDAAITQSIDREKFTKANALRLKRSQQWDSIRGLVVSNTMDRGPTRLKPLKSEDLLPSGDSAYYGYG